MLFLKQFCLLIAKTRSLLQDQFLIFYTKVRISFVVGLIFFNGISYTRYCTLVIYRIDWKARSWARLLSVNFLASLRKRKSEPTIILGSVVLVGPFRRTCNTSIPSSAETKLAHCARSISNRETPETCQNTLKNKKNTEDDKRA